MKKTLILLVLAVAALTLHAQDADFRQATRDLITLNNAGISPKQIRETMKNALAGAIDQTTPAGDAETAKATTNAAFDALLGDYYESGEMTDDLVDIMAPIYQREFTLDEMRKIKALYTSPEGQVFLDKSAQMTQHMGAATQKLMAPIMAIAMGGKAPDVERVDCPADYRAAFMDYFNATGSAAMDAIKGRMKGVHDSEKILTYLQEAVPEFSLALAYPTLTLDELKAGTHLVSDPLIQRYIKASASVDDKALAPLMKKIQSKLTK